MVAAVSVSDPGLPVEVAYARADRQWLLALVVPAGATAADALHASGLLVECPELQVGEPVLGIWSRQVRADTRLVAGDRVEVYRPLVADPKTARRRRAARQRSPRTAATSE